MPLTINTNIASIQSERALSLNRGNMETAMQRLSSGKRINSALDDASGLAVANRMRNQIEGLNMAIRNANDGISLAQTAEGAMEEIQNVLLRMRELAIQSSNGTYTDEDRSYIAAEFDELTKEIRRVSNQAAWDGDVKLIAEGAKAQQVQVGINAADYIKIPLQSLTAEDLNLADKNVVLSDTGATIEKIDFVSLANATQTNAAFPDLAAVPSGATIGSNITDFNFTKAVKPNFEMKLWNGARDGNGNPEGQSANYNTLTAVGVTSVTDLIEQLKAHPKFDPTTCDLRLENGELKVIWKIAGQPDPDTSLIVTNKDSLDLGTIYSFTISQPIIGGHGDAGVGAYTTGLVAAATQTVTLNSGATISVTRPAHYQQKFDVSALEFHRETIPKSEGNFFSLQIGDRVLTADNVTDVNDLVKKLKEDSDYEFVREQVGLGDTTLDLFETYDAGSPPSRTQKLYVNFGVNATNRAFLYQSKNNVTITDPESAISALDYVDAAAKVVNESRARMGATMSRIEYTINNLMNLVENTEEAKSRVLDTDYAKESAELAKAQILAQAGTAMLAQANQSQQYVLNLLRQG